jgi:hypothetical protein
MPRQPRDPSTTLPGAVKFRCWNRRTKAGTRQSMKMLNEYLERALSLERLAAGEQDSTFKEQLLNQAQAYRKLAAKRAEQYGLPAPSPPETPS